MAANNLAPMMYDGSTNPNTFVRHFKLQALFQAWDDAAQLLALPIFLKGQAKDNYTIIRTTKNAIDDVLKDLITMCSQPCEVLLDEFFERKLRPGESISSFAKTLKDLLNQAEPTLPAANHKTLLLRQLSKSLPPHMQTQINFNSTMAWNELLANLDKQNVQQLKWDLQVQHEIPANLIKTEPADVNWASTSYGNSRPQYQSNNSDNYASSSRFTEPERFNGTCNYCNKFGHKETDCRKRKRDEQQGGAEPESANRYQNRSSQQMQQPQTNHQQYTQRQSRPQRNNYNNANSFSNTNNRYNNQQNSSNNQSNNNQTNTNALSLDSNQIETNKQSSAEPEFRYFTANVDTMEAWEKTNTPLLKLRVQLTLFNQDPQFVLALIDGGSSHSFISPSVLTIAQLRIAGSRSSTLFRRENFKINGATGSSNSSCCVTSAKIQFDQWSGIHEFVISGSVTRHDMIIGRDFFKAHKVTVNHGNDSKIVDSIPINLNVIHTITNPSMNDENHEFLNTNEPFEPTNDQIANLQNQIDQLKAHRNEKETAFIQTLNELQVAPMIPITVLNVEEIQNLKTEA